MRECRICGCIEDAHQHYHSRTYCGNCGIQVCRAFRPIRWYHQLRNRRPYAKRIGLDE